jgi:hypothetical protein
VDLERAHVLMAVDGWYVNGPLLCDATNAMGQTMVERAPAEPVRVYMYILTLHCSVSVNALVCCSSRLLPVLFFGSVRFHQERSCKSGLQHAHYNSLGRLP